MLSKNKTRIEKLEHAHIDEDEDDFIAIKFIDGDKTTYKRKGKEHKEEEFKELYPKATILTVKFIS